MKYDEYLDLTVLEDLYYQWRKYFYYNMADYKEFKLIFRRVLKFILVNHFNYIVDILNNKNIRILTNILLPECKLSYENMMLYAIKFPDSNNSNLEFHWWDKKGYRIENIKVILFHKT